MRFIVLVKANRDSEAGAIPDQKLLSDMGRYNQDLLNAGIMLAGEGLQPSSRGARVKFGAAGPTVTNGPFPETAQLVAGYWLWQVKSKEEAIEWLTRAPFGGDTEVELRQLHEAEDFAASDPSGELRAQEERQRKQAAANARR